MTSDLSTFLEYAPFDGILAAIASVPRIILAAKKPEVGLAAKIGIFISSVATGVCLAYVARHFPQTEKMAPIVALASGFLAQDIVMTFASTGKKGIDTAAEIANDRLKKLTPGNDDETPPNQ